MTTTLISGVHACRRRAAQATPLRRGRRALKALGFGVELDASVRLRHQRFAGNDDERLATLYRVADAAPSIAMAAAAATA